ncbi:NnrU family protein [Ruegeria litorea]|uniref:NnrU family protein n=1 Tax=Falsiruegeria litorea TaxID=1280831 RepID=A0ABS5WK28_9RHOB|nr:NnrU family protein [Falsiruegeria litorea]MBT3139474.1 NnrU family protein [Falsiruegeria litorea]
MTGWIEFLFALLVFLLSHVIPVRPPVRPWLIVRLGRGGYFAAYSAVSTGILVWLIVAAARAPYVEVIPPLDVLRWIPLVMMPLVCVLIVGGMTVNNPFSFGGLGRRVYDSDRPGILALSRHPLLLALMGWSVVHMLANGDLAHVILFGLFALFAGLGMVMIDRRKARDMGPGWSEMIRNTARISVVGAGQVPWQAWVGGFGLYALFLWGHAWVIGVSPLPF